MLQKTIGVVVTFHPEPSSLQNILSLLEQVDHVVVVDNDSSDSSKALLDSLKKNTVSCIYNQENLGVATGFNQGIKYGIENGFEFYLLMDQDSRPKEGMVEKLLSTILSFERKGRLVLVGPSHFDFSREINQYNTNEIEAWPLLITSGCLISKRIVEKIGFYDERLFIDHVDHDYSLRLIKFGGECLKLNSAVLQHRFGEAEVKKIFGKSFFLQDYSPFRRYFMMRNRIVLYKRYGLFSGSWFWIDLRSAVKDIIKLVFFESGKARKLRAVVKGLFDGIRWKD